MIELERQWKRSGLNEDEAALLAELVRAQQLDQDQLDLAASFEHAGALLALEVGQPESLVGALDDSAWLDALAESHGKPALVAVALGLAHYLLPRWTDFSRSDRPGQMVKLAESWLGEQTDANRMAANKSAQSLSSNGWQEELGLVRAHKKRSLFTWNKKVRNQFPPGVVHAEKAARLAASTAGATNLARALRQVSDSLAMFSDENRVGMELVHHAKPPVDVADARRLVTGRLAHWALGRPPEAWKPAQHEVCSKGKQEKTAKKETKKPSSSAKEMPAWLRDHLKRHGG